MAQWAVIVAISVFTGGALHMAGIPAALFLGPMAAGVVAGVNGATVRVPVALYRMAQGIVGILIAQALTPQILTTFRQEWLLFVPVVLSVMAASSLLGYLISRWHVLPGTAGVWGASPGGATAMVLMAEAFGADARLVAFMQYLRVIFVAVAAAVVARFFAEVTDVPAPGIVWFPAIDPEGFSWTVALIALGVPLGVLLKIPAGAMLAPMLAGTALHLSGYASFQLPEWLLVIGYALIGWSIGLSFTRQVVLHAARALPQIVASIVTLILFCCALAFLLSRILGIDLLTAYLATSPGGMDSIAIIASASGSVDLSLVMALQAVRFFLVLILGAPIARMVARWVR
ncbi:MAG: AbrB family transcriptional regulator [Hyphomicrobiales bacterium]|nr:AbrB family transcriptional regulator [Hyphomicrobiales bacterium]